MYMVSSAFSQLLTLLVNLTGDWFIAITLITLGIKLLLFPLSIKQQKVQLLTVNLTKARTILSKKFHNQIKKVNEESMKIASKYKINPLFTFASLIIQAPVFFSLYAAVTHLSVPIGSILIPWVSDLHVADHLHILPVIAGLLQTLSVFTAENKNLLMFIFPVVIGVVFLWKAPVALSAYWIANSVLRFVEVQIFRLGPIQRKYLNIPSPEEMVQRL
ncbi:preprotein translocase YidC [Dehalobacter sp. MCB1]|nr:preprotein translocase YidC [Dehalobacter sp. MCB1]TCX50511.1 preprotein translocase YidC [Dehalobacter sp. 14DCB1]TCX52249.1 preprotein translocase YidC [Dehalobacter sp. 12DCB1]